MDGPSRMADGQPLQTNQSQTYKDENGTTYFWNEVKSFESQVRNLLQTLLYPKYDFRGWYMLQCTDGRVF